LPALLLASTFLLLGGLSVRRPSRDGQGRDERPGRGLHCGSGWRNATPPTSLERQLL